MTAAKKIDIINGAYSQLRISGLTRQPEPEDLRLALVRLENMAQEFFSRNICTDYNFEDVPNEDSLSNVPAEFLHMFETNLGMRLAPDFNLQVNPVLLSQANQSLSNASARYGAARLRQTAYPARMPIGAGNTLRYRPSSRY